MESTFSMKETPPWNGTVELNCTLFNLQFFHAGEAHKQVNIFHCWIKDETNLKGPYDQFLKYLFLGIYSGDACWGGAEKELEAVEKDEGIVERGKTQKETVKNVAERKVVRENVDN